MPETNRSATDATLAGAVPNVDTKDVFRVRDRSRRRRIIRLLVFLVVLDGFLVYRLVTHNPLNGPQIEAVDLIVWLPLFLGIALIASVGLIVAMPLFNGRSPHLIVRPEQIEVGLDEVQGLGTQVDEVTRTLDVFLGYATFRNELGGTPRRGILFEGPPGTGKTYLAKAMAKQAGVPFLFIAAPAFQSMWFGMTPRRIRGFFKSLRKAARKEGGAIGFIEEIDAVGQSRGAVSSAAPEGIAGRVLAPMIAPGDQGMVNELLVQMQSFDQPSWRARFKARFVEVLNAYLPPEKRIPALRREYHNILLIAATNRAEALDPALLRPGRFDRRLYFDLPTKRDRRQLIDFFLDRKSHHEQLDQDAARERLSHDTLGYTPVMIEHLFDESLLVALRGGRRKMSVDDVYEAKLTEEIGIKQPVVYTDADRSAVATHEAGHATVAYFLGRGRRLEVLSIIKRRQSLGLLAHGDEEERFTRSRSDIESQIAIALGGIAAEETFLGESGTGPASDLAAATDLAAKMVGAFGMAGSLISFEAVGGGVLDTKNLVAKVLGDGDGKQRVEDILTTQKQRVGALLEDNRDVVVALRDALLARDELVGDEILQVIEIAISSRS